MNVFPFFLGAQSAPNIADLFSITLDTAANLDGVSTTGWDLLVGKSRVNATDWVWRDSAQGISDYIESNTTNDAAAFSDYATLLGSGNGVLYRYKKHPKFCDVVAFSHVNGVTSNVATGLTAPLGFATVKRLDDVSDWYTNHRGLTAGNNLRLNTTAAQSATNAYVSFSGSTVVFDSAAPSGDYVLYVWGHDTSGTGVVQAGVYTGNGSATGPVITLGWQPQWLYRKRVNGVSNHLVQDDQRYTSNPNDTKLSPDTSGAEVASVTFNIDLNPTGFQPTNGNAAGNANGELYVYLAIRSPS